MFLVCCAVLCRDTPAHSVCLLLLCSAVSPRCGVHDRGGCQLWLCCPWGFCGSPTPAMRGYPVAPALPCPGREGCCPSWCPCAALSCHTEGSCYGTHIPLLREACGGRGNCGSALTAQAAHTTPCPPCDLQGLWTNELGSNTSSLATAQLGPSQAPTTLQWQPPTRRPWCHPCKGSSSIPMPRDIPHLASLCSGSSQVQQ